MSTLPISHEIHVGTFNQKKKRIHVGIDFSSCGYCALKPFFPSHFFQFLQKLPDTSLSSDVAWLGEGSGRWGKNIEFLGKDKFVTLIIES